VRSGFCRAGDRLAAAAPVPVLALTCGTFGNVLRLLPPLVIAPALLADALDVLDAATASAG
jgi:4-aminobutyrate aminotransferase / (S)-3-amino-2-methylpropionate transaminase / 5-aminovalerate transaminase